jgi:hypothetical protein
VFPTLFTLCTGSIVVQLPHSLDCRRDRVFVAGAEVFIFFTASSSALEPTPTPSKWVLADFLRSKAAGA